MLRRSLLAATVLAAAAGLPPLRPAAAQAVDPGNATAFIQGIGNEMVSAINGAGDANQRRARVADILRRSVDIDGVARFVLGRWWRTATAPEQAEYMRLFEETLVRNLSARFGEYQGVRFSLGRSQQRADEGDVLVNTVIERPGNPAFSLDWRVGQVGGGPKIVDVVAEGTSLRLTQRSEYSAVVSRNNGRIGALLDAMRSQIAQLAAREGR